MANLRVVRNVAEFLVPSGTDSSTGEPRRSRQCMGKRRRRQRRRRQRAMVGTVVLAKYVVHAERSLRHSPVHSVLCDVHAESIVCNIVHIAKTVHAICTETRRQTC